MNVFNQYSYPIIGFAICIALFFLLRRFTRMRLIMILGIEMGIVLAGFAGLLLLRPGESTVTSIASAQAMLNNGKPTFLEFFSNYCTGCLTFEPIVDALVTDIEEDFNILRVDIHTDFGRELRRQLSFSFTPEFVLFDSSGREIWRDHIPPSMAELDRARES